MNRLHALLICFFIVGITTYAHSFIIDTTGKIADMHPAQTTIPALLPLSSPEITVKEKPNTLISENIDTSKKKSNCVKSNHAKAVQQTSVLLYETLSDLGEVRTIDSVYLETVYHSK